MSDEMVLLIIP